MDKKTMKYKISWGVNQYRKDKRTGPINPVPRSEYLKKLFQEEENRFKLGDGKDGSSN